MSEVGTPTLVAEGNHLVVRIPLQFKRRGGRKEIIVPDGMISNHDAPPPTNKPLALAVARAHRWRELLESGRYTTIRELACDLGLDNSYVARILRLSLLAPDIVEAIVHGDEPDCLSLARLTHLPALWQEQRQCLGFRSQAT
jgi:hypothetical protein